jgi:hypothetical protein
METANRFRGIAAAVLVLSTIAAALATTLGSSHATPAEPGTDGQSIGICSSSAQTDYPTIDFRTLPDEITTNIPAFPVTGTVSSDTNEVLVNDIPIAFSSHGFTEPVDLQERDNDIKLTFVDRDGERKTWRKRIVFDPKNYSTGDKELLYANISYHVTRSDANEDGVVVIDPRRHAFVGLIRDTKVEGIRRDGSEIILAHGERCSTDTHAITGTLPSYPQYTSVLFSHDNRFVYYPDREVSLESNQITRTFDQTWPQDISLDDRILLYNDGYLDLGTGIFTPVDYYCGLPLPARKVLDPSGDLVLTSCYGGACGEFKILRRVDGSELCRHWVGCPAGDYALDIVLSPDGRTAYAGYRGNPVTGGGVVLIIDMERIQVVESFALHGGGGLCISETGRLYASASDESIMELVPTPDREWLVTAAAYSVPTAGWGWGIVDIYHKGAPLDAVPIYRFWSSKTSRHFYTSDEAEKSRFVNESDTWTLEGVAFYVNPCACEPNLVPVYRLSSQGDSRYFWTISESERDALTEQDPDAWTFDGVVFYVYPEGLQPVGSVPVYRFRSKDTNCQFFTISENEKNNLITNYTHVWALDGIAWYTLAQP